MGDITTALKDMEKHYRVEHGRGIDWKTLTCQEASVLSRETFIPCGHKAISIIWHNRDRRAYAMCEACAHHNISNRGGILLAIIEE